MPEQTTFWHRYEIPIVLGGFFIGLAMIVFGVIRDYWEISTAGWFLMPLATGYMLARFRG